MMTEETTHKEAKGKMCPILSVIKKINDTCVGSDCMIWREQFQGNGQPHVPEKGFCGLGRRHDAIG